MAFEHHSALLHFSVLGEEMQQQEVYEECNKKGRPVGRPFDDMENYDLFTFHTTYAECVQLVVDQVVNHVAVAVGHVAVGLCAVDFGG